MVPGILEDEKLSADPRLEFESHALRRPEADVADRGPERGRASGVQTALAAELRVHSHGGLAYELMCLGRKLRPVLDFRDPHPHSGRLSARC